MTLTRSWGKDFNSPKINYFASGSIPGRQENMTQKARPKPKKETPWTHAQDKHFPTEN